MARRGVLVVRFMVYGYFGAGGPTLEQYQPDSNRAAIQRLTSVWVSLAHANQTPGMKLLVKRS
jgi:hypothetical protein